MSKTLNICLILADKNVSIGRDMKLSPNATVDMSSGDDAQTNLPDDWTITTGY